MEVIPASRWHYVRNSDNSADIASRGISAAKFLNFKFWHTGLNWLTADVTDSRINVKLDIPRSRVTRKTSC